MHVYAALCVHGLPPRCERSIAKVPSLVIRSLVSVRPPNAPEAHPPLARGESLGPRGAPAPRGCWSEGWSEGCGSAARPESSVPSQCHHFRPPLTVQATGRIPSSARRGATVPGSRTRPSARPCARSTPLSPPRCPAWRDTSPAGRPARSKCRLGGATACDPGRLRRRAWALSRSTHSGAAPQLISPQRQ